jgi:NTE family protein
VHASCAVPGFVAPVLIDGCWCGEGGMADMLPAHVLRGMGAEIVIGVDIFSPCLHKRLGPLGYFIDGLETALQHSGGGVLQTDCLISPCLGGQTYLRFSQREKLYALGRQAALEKLPEIRRVLDL